MQLVITNKSYLIAKKNQNNYQYTSYYINILHVMEQDDALILTIIKEKKDNDITTYKFNRFLI